MTEEVYLSLLLEIGVKIISSKDGDDQCTADAAAIERLREHERSAMFSMEVL